MHIEPNQEGQDRSTSLVEPSSKILKVFVPSRDLTESREKSANLDHSLVEVSLKISDMVVAFPDFGTVELWSLEQTKDVRGEKG